ncbi:MAG: DNA replication/repair protein RecF [Clostridia bacterium]|nr:DNA replication/repair protein RecF [Clostridia bacterium]
MTVKNLRVDNFRNIKNIELFPCDEVNILFGQNAQGKTNLLEALWLCSGARSFRDSREKDLIKFGEKTSEINAQFFANNREQNIKLEISEKKKFLLNKTDIKSSSELIGVYNAVIFSPDHLSLVKSGPEVRRKFLDDSLCRLKSGAKGLVNEYKRVVIQRNALLKESIQNPNKDMLDFWNNLLAEYGAKLCRQRQKYLEAIKPYATQFYSGLTKENETLDLKYEGEKYSFDDGKELLLLDIEKNMAEDEKYLTTTTGPHRQDLFVTINGISARNFGSQGQQRSAAISLKLAESSFMNEFFGEQPIVLLDDVMSELDKSRQDYILNRLKGMQVFITCCDADQISKMTGGKCFEIEKGNLIL